MKKEQEINQIEIAFQNCSNQLSNPRKKIECIGKRPAYLTCLNKHCEKYSFVCDSNQCQCFKQHVKCLHVSTKTIGKIIFDKIISIQSLEQLINQRIDKIIDELSIARQKTLLQLKNNFVLFGLSQFQKQFIQSLQNGDVEDFTGKKMWELHLHLQKQQQVLKSLSQAQKNITHQFQELSQSAQLFSIQIDQAIQKLKIESQHFLSNTKCEYFQKSRILGSHEEIVKLQLFFGKLKFKGVQLLYRASQNDFNVERFHLKCDNIPHTLIICETEFGKIIGGYTPISWETHQNWQYAKDQTSCSFIFSLSNNDKFCLHQPSRAVIHRNDFNFGPQFGGGSDLIISDKANINSNSFSRVNTSYCNKHYQQYEKESYKRFSGSESQFFRIKEWEVWKVQFLQPDQ